MSHQNDVGFSRQYRAPTTHPYSAIQNVRICAVSSENRIWRSSSVSALTDCECASNEDALMKSLSSMIRCAPANWSSDQDSREPNMNIQRLREVRHGYFKMAVALLPIALLVGCNSAPTGAAPGVAGGQAL